MEGEAYYQLTRVDNRKWNSVKWDGTLVCDILDLDGDTGDYDNPWDWLKWSKIDTVVHLAAQINVDHSCLDMLDTYYTNVMGTLNLVKKCIETNTRMVLASSSEVYGSHDRPITEEFPLNGQSPYAASKIAADRLCYAAMETWPEFDCTIVRPFNTFGPGQRADSYGGVIAKFIQAALEGEDLIIYGDGKQSRDYVYIMDTVRAFKMAVDGRLPPVCNIATGKTHRIVDIAHDIIEMTNSSSKVLHTDPRPGEVHCLIGDASLARAHNWEPRVNFREGLFRCVKSAKCEPFGGDDY